MEQRRQITLLDDGWADIQEGINKLINILEGRPETQFMTDEYMLLYTNIYNMCTQRNPYNYSRQLYDKYKGAFDEYITELVRKTLDTFGIPLFVYDRGVNLIRRLINSNYVVVVPVLKWKHGEFLLRELVKRWENHIVMVGWLSRFFFYLDRYFISLRSLPSLNAVGLTCFRDLVYHELNEQVRTAVISLIHQEREGEQIDRALLKNVLDIFVTVGVEDMTLILDDIALHEVTVLLKDMMKQVALLKQSSDTMIKGMEEASILNRRIIKSWESARLQEEIVDSSTNLTPSPPVITLPELSIIGLEGMDKYESDFEAAFLDDTSAYYEQKASSWISEYSCPDYMLKAEECLKLEKDRVSHYLHSSTEPKLLEKVQHELLAKVESRILEKEHSGCQELLIDNKVEDLSRMFRLFSKVPRGLEPVSDIFQKHVTTVGITLVKQAEDAAANKTVFVTKVIELHDKYMAYVNGLFQNHTLFHKALKEAFDVFCNKDVSGSTSAELLATFCDNILKKGAGEKLDEEAIEETLEKVVKLLAYISDKDLFAEFYRKKLARRLLFGMSANEDHEKTILTKLKQQNGGQFTSKMEGMVTDLALAIDYRISFAGYLINNPGVSPGIDFNITVLTSGHWPTYKSFDLNLPKEMVKCIEVFKKFYHANTQKRKLTWIYSLGSCNVIGKFDKKNIELTVTTYQAAALLLFNTSDRLSYSEVKSQLNLADEDVVRLLHSLSCGKYKILSKEPNTKTILQTDYFQFNPKFTDKMRRIKVPLPPVDEKKKIIEDVDKDRRYAIDASLVRIMKSRKVLGHQQLVVECAEQMSLMFKPDIKIIKKRIEDLIGRDYLERDIDNANTYKYVA